MNIVMVIPTYWGRKRGDGYKTGDAIYDHPTPLDEEGTLIRLLKSLKILKDKNFEVVILAIPIATDLEDTMTKKILRTVEKIKEGVKFNLLFPNQVRKLKNILTEKRKDRYIPLIGYKGYPEVRNLGLIAARILSADLVIMIDDDEIFEDPFFIEKAKEFIGLEKDGKKVLGIGGYYINPNGNYNIKKEIKPWMAYWNKAQIMNQAFDKIIGQPPRYKLTPFVFGGNMIIHKELFTHIPFDPAITRGEDIDYLINARMFCYNIYLDNLLSIKHDPPPKFHPQWRQLREDIYRFIFEREKLRKQRPITGMQLVTPEDLDPYPGFFLRDDLEEKVFKSNMMLGMDAITSNDKETYYESMKNILISVTDAYPKNDPFENLLKLKEDWELLMHYLGEEKVKKEIKERLLFGL
ncbi:MAG: hypothetical protein DRG20_05110 [Deltaproteobacteria bacterium]|nr:hypothetical protein [Deltaproteobacteria bacterium]RLA89143.1 MAG: hypothetical protein DRG20_05110 [Deltaproteobacteria bacterium]